MDNTTTLERPKKSVEADLETQSKTQLLAFWRRGEDGRLEMTWVSAQVPRPSGEPRLR